MKNRLHLLIMMASLLLVLLLSACGQAGLGQSRHFTKHFNEAVVTGNDYVPKFVAQGGAKTDGAVLLPA